MDYKLFISLVKEKCRFLENEGFAFREVDRNIWYDKTGETEGHRISFAYTIYGHKFHVHALMAGKRFNAIEKFLQKRSGGEFIDCTIHVGPNESAIPTELSYIKTKNNFHFDIETSTQLSYFLDSVKNFYEQTVLPFYQTYTSIAEVNTRLSNLKHEELASLISNYGNLAFARVFIIKSLIEPSVGEQYYQYILNELSRLKGNKTIDEITEHLNTVREEITDQGLLKNDF